MDYGFGKHASTHTQASCQPWKASLSHPNNLDAIGRKVGVKSIREWEQDHLMCTERASRERLQLTTQVPPGLDSMGMCSRGRMQISPASLPSSMSSSISTAFSGSLACMHVPLTPQISKLTSQLEYDRRADISGTVAGLERDLAAEQAAQGELNEVCGW